MEITVRFAAQVIEAVREVAAGEILPRYRSVAAERKDDGSIVTEADRAAQRALVRRLAAIEAVPVLGEEMPAAQQQFILGTAPRFWCVDPLDGTKNFSEAIPCFAVSVALMEGVRPVFGIVYDPIADEAYYATRGGGAWLNNRPLLLPAEGPALAGATAEVSLRREISRLRGPLKRHRPYAKRVTGGSATLAWCHLAAARTDVLLHGSQKMWDWAAGSLILLESGGHACAVETDDYWSAPAWGRSAIAARTLPLMAEWREWVRRAMRELPALPPAQES